MKKAISGTVSDLVGSFLYYDRKEDEELPRGVIEADIASGDTSIDEIVELFKAELTKGVPQCR